jgi:glycosyltransferase involved in cell wall biosynthesis
MKKVLIAVARGEMGGAQRFVALLAEGLKDSFDLHVAFGPEGNYLRGELDTLGVRYHLIPHLRRTHNPLAALLSFYEALKLLRSLRPEIVHINSSNTLIFAPVAYLLPKRPRIVYTLHGLSYADPGHTMNTFLKHLYITLYRIGIWLADEVVFVSERDRKEALSLGLIQSSQGIVVRNSISTISFIDRNDARDFLSEKAGRDLKDVLIVGTIGRLAYPKNQVFLIQMTPEILKHHPSAVLVIIGEGPDRAGLEKTIEDLGLEEKVFLVGHVDHASRYLKAFDVFVLPSFYEGMSLSLLEAQQAGIPVLTSDVGGNKETLDEYKKGYLYRTREDFLRAFQDLNSFNIDLLHSTNEYDIMVKEYSHLFATL